MSTRTLAAATAAALALAVPAAATTAAAPVGTWVPTAYAPEISWVNGHAAFPNGTGFVGGGLVPVPGGGFRRTLYTTTDHGATWDVSPTALPDVRSLAFGTETSWWGVAGAAALAHTADAGATWSTVALPLAAGERALRMVDPAARDGAVAVALSLATGTCAEHDAIFSSGDGGATWQRHDLPAYAAGGGLVHSLDVRSDDNAAAVVFNDVAPCGNTESTMDVLTTTDGGATWTTVIASPATGPQVLDATLAADGTLLACYNDGTIRTSTDGGATFTTRRLRQPVVESLPANLTGWLDAAIDVELVDGAGWAVLSGGAIYRTTDDGATWDLDGLHASTIGTRLAAFDADTAFTVAQGVVVTRR